MNSFRLLRVVFFAFLFYSNLNNCSTLLLLLHIRAAQKIVEFQLFNNRRSPSSFAAYSHKKPATGGRRCHFVFELVPIVATAVVRRVAPDYVLTYYCGFFFGSKYKVVG